MPYLDRSRIKQWLMEHDWTVRRLAEATDIPPGTLKEAVAGRDQIRWARVLTLSRFTGIALKVIVAPGTEIPREVLAEETEDASEPEDDGAGDQVKPKKEKTAPDRRSDRPGPPRAKVVAA